MLRTLSGPHVGTGVPGTGYVALHTGSYAALYEGGRDYWNQAPTSL